MRLGPRLIELDELVERHALDIDSTLRTSDAIHLATAVLMSEELDAFVCYDERLVQAARDVGLAVAAPAA